MSDSKNIKLFVLFFLIVFSVFFVVWNDDNNNSFKGMTEGMTIEYSNNEIDLSFNQFPTSVTVQSTVVIPTNFFGMDGTTCIYKNSTITITSPDGTVTVYTTTGTNTDITQNTFYGPNGGFCKIFTDGTSYFIEVQPANGSMFFLTSNAPYSGVTSSPPYTTDPYSMFSSPYPNTAASMFTLKSAIVPPVCPRCPDVNPALVADIAMYKKNNNNNNTSTASNTASSSSSNNTSSNPSTSPDTSSSNNSSSTNNSSSNNSSSSSLSGLMEDSWYNNDSTKYNSSSSDSNNNNSSNGKCRPCKPCGRCPEPNFECKKVPNYDIINMNDPGLLPITGAGTGYSTFGM